MSSKLDDMLDSLIGYGTSNVAHDEYLVAIDDVAFGDVSPGRVVITQACQKMRKTR